MGHISVNQSPIGPHEVNGLHAVHLLMPSQIDNLVKPSVMNNVHSVQSKLLVTAINGGLDVTKLFRRRVVLTLIRNTRERPLSSSLKDL